MVPELPWRPTLHQGLVLQIAPLINSTECPHVLNIFSSNIYSPLMAVTTHNKENRRPFHLSKMVLLSSLWVSSKAPFIDIERSTQDIRKQGRSTPCRQGSCQYASAGYQRGPGLLARLLAWLQYLLPTFYPDSYHARENLMLWCLSLCL